MDDPNRSDAAPIDELTVSWDLIPDERAPSTAIIMRFASYEAAHGALTAAGFTAASGSVLPHPRAIWPASIRYSHPDGSTVVLAGPIVEPRDGDERHLERLGRTAVGG